MFKFNPLSGFLDLIRPLVVGDMILQGEFDASGGVLPPDVSKGYYWTVTVAGTIGSLTLNVGDSLVAKNTVVGATAETDFFKVDAVGDPIITDTISERTPNAGVTIDNLPIKDAGFGLAGSADGDLYQRTAGALARIPIGANTEVLTSDGLVPSWQPAPGGGGGISQFDATVADTGADFTDIDTAYNAGHKKLLISGDLTMTADVTIDTQNLYVFIPEGVTLNTGAFIFDMTVASKELTIEGQGLINTASTTSPTFGGAVDNSQTIKLSGLDIISGNSSNIPITKYGDMHIVDVHLTCPNITNGGLEFFSANYKITNLHLTGGGSSCINGLNASTSSSSGVIGNIFVDGTWSANGMMNFSGDITLGDVNYDSASTTKIKFVGFAIASNIRSFGGGINIDCSDEIYLSNCYLKNGKIDLPSNINNCFINNVFAFDLDLSNTGALNNNISNSTFTFLRLAGNGNQFSNCDFSSVIGSMSASDCMFSNCRFVNAFTITGSSNIFTGNKITGTITDSGTGNIFNDGISRNGDMHIHANAIPTVIDTVNTPHMVQGLFIADLLSNFTFVAGSTGTITAMAAGVNTTITSTAHGLVNGDVVSISGTTSYNGVFIISAVTANTFDISAVFVANDATGSWYKGDALKVSTGSGGRYKLNFNGYGNLVSGNNKFFLYEVYINGIPRPVVESRRKYNSAGDIGSFSGDGNVDIVDGDVICLAITGQTDLSNFIFEHVNVSLHKIG